MELDLNTVRKAREVEGRIKAELSQLPIAEQKSVLERVIVDVLAALEDQRPSRQQPVFHLAAPQPAPAPAGTDGASWEAIVRYCRENARGDGSFHNKEIAKALYPSKLEADSNKTISTIYTTTKRRSVGVSKDPYFVLLGNGRFRLATEEERLVARNKL